MNIDKLLEMQTKTAALSVPFASPMTTYVALLMQKNKVCVSGWGPQLLNHWDQTFHKKAKEEVKEYSKWLAISEPLAVEMARQIYILRCQTVTDPGNVVFNVLEPSKYFKMTETTLPEMTAMNVFFHTLDSLVGFRTQMASAVSPGVGTAAVPLNKLYNEMIETAYERYIEQEGPGLNNGLYDAVMELIENIVRDSVETIAGHARVDDIIQKESVTAARTVRTILTGLYQDRHVAETLTAHFFKEDYFEFFKPSCDDEERAPETATEEDSLENFGENGSDPQFNLETTNLVTMLKDEGFTTLSPEMLSYLKSRHEELFDDYQIATDKEITVEGFFATVGKGIRTAVKKLLRLMADIVNRALKLIGKPFGVVPVLKINDDKDMLEEWRKKFNSALHDKLEEVPRWVTDLEFNYLPILSCKEMILDIEANMISVHGPAKQALEAMNQVELSQINRGYSDMLTASYKKLISIPGQARYFDDINYDIEVHEFKPGVLDNKHLGDDAVLIVKSIKDRIQEMRKAKVKERFSSDEALRRCYGIPLPEKYDEAVERIEKELKYLTDTTRRIEDKIIPLESGKGSSETDPIKRELSKQTKAYNANLNFYLLMMANAIRIASGYAAIFRLYAYDANNMGVSARAILDN
ncbi:hypothetical protein [Vibrio phage BONAISHI]|nr:hypothetical protein [Vibrio phage BONAISHI]